MQLDLARTAADSSVFDGFDGYVVSVEPPGDPAGAESLLHHGVAAVAVAAANRGAPIVLVSQIYVTRPQALAGMEAITEARARGEDAARATGGDYAIVRPGWLHDNPAVGSRLEQGAIPAMARPAAIASPLHACTCCSMPAPAA